MRIFNSSIPMANIYNCSFGETEDQKAIEALCEVLEISIFSDPENLAPSDARALKGLLDFLDSRSGGVHCGTNHAYTVVNMNTGKSILFLLLQIDYNGSF